MDPIIKYYYRYDRSQRVFTLKDYNRLRVVPTIPLDPFISIDDKELRDTEFKQYIMHHMCEHGMVPKILEGTPRMTDETRDDAPEEFNLADVVSRLYKELGFKENNQPYFDGANALEDVITMASNGGRTQVVRRAQAYLKRHKEIVAYKKKVEKAAEEAALRRAQYDAPPPPRPAVLHRPRVVRDRVSQMGIIDIDANSRAAPVNRRRRAINRNAGPYTVQSEDSDTE